MKKLAAIFARIKRLFEREVQCPCCHADSRQSKGRDGKCKYCDHCEGYGGMPRPRPRPGKSDPKPVDEGKE